MLFFFFFFLVTQNCRASFKKKKKADMRRFSPRMYAEFQTKKVRTLQFFFFSLSFFFLVGKKGKESKVLGFVLLVALRRLSMCHRAYFVQLAYAVFFFFYFPSLSLGLFSRFSDALYGRFSLIIIKEKGNERGDVRVCDLPTLLFFFLVASSSFQILGLLCCSRSQRS